MSTKAHQSITTAAVHAGEPKPRIGGAVTMPIFQSSTFLYEGETDYHATRYVRLSNTPNHEVLHAKLAVLEHAEAAIVTSSGMAAISTALLAEFCTRLVVSVDPPAPWRTTPTTLLSITDSVTEPVWAFRTSPSWLS